MNRQFEPVHGLYSTSHKNPAFYGDISAVSLVFYGENTNQQQGFCSRSRSGQSIKKGPKYSWVLFDAAKGPAAGSWVFWLNHESHKSEYAFAVIRACDGSTQVGCGGWLVTLLLDQRSRRHATLLPTQLRGVKDWQRQCRRFIDWTTLR